MPYVLDTHIVVQASRANFAAIATGFHPAPLVCCELKDPMTSESVAQPKRKPFNKVDVGAGSYERSSELKTR